MVQEKLMKIVIVCGPTAVGKTTVGTELARHFAGEIVNADSQQVWKGLDIGTAKPDPEIRAEIPHHLLDIADPAESFDASRFISLADEAIKEIVGRGKNVFVVGGTGMYIRMLVHGLCGAPPGDEKLRLKLSKEIEDAGIEKLHERLARIDPVTAKVVHKNDRTRIVRALEIFESCGVPASEFYRQHRFDERRYNSLKIGLDIPRDDLYGRIDRRVDQMLGEGWTFEVESLVKKYGIESQAFSAIGYREIASHLAGEMSMDDAVELIKRNSRRFAKRQLTWFRADREIVWFGLSQMEQITREVKEFLSNN